MRVRLPLSAWIPLVGISLGLVCLAYFVVDSDMESVEVIDYRTPPPNPDEELADDLLKDKNPAFIPDLIDRRLEGAWQINSSAAVLRLDAPILKPDADAELLALRPTYAEAMMKAPSWLAVLPSINLIDGKAKQFDDGLFAAIDLAYFRGLKPKLPSLVTLIKQMHERVPTGSQASSYLAAGLKIANVDVKISEPDQVSAWLHRFESSAMYSKPFSFYTWTPELTQVFRFVRYFQQPLPISQPDLIGDLARCLPGDEHLMSQYKQVQSVYARLTNPLTNLTLADVPPNGEKLPKNTPPIAIFPTSRSKESDLIGKLFPLGVPPDVDLMKEIIQAIRLGKVNLAPSRDSGWYEHQIYALETFLLPEKGEENQKLLLTKAYKKRMLEAFQALMTKRRETHARNLEVKSAAAELPPRAQIKPRLRVEPGPSFYLRTARSYDFLLNFLTATVGEEGLKSLHGWKDGGERSKTLLEELRWTREFFYGLHFVSAEDIGMAHGLRTDEPVDRAACEATAAQWLANYRDDLDLRIDTRVSVPIYFDVFRRRTQLWMTLGVRLAKLHVSYAKPPRIRPLNSKDNWQDVEHDQLESVEYVIAVDEFAEVDIPGLQPLSRVEFRDACNAGKTRPAILQRLSQRSP
jgi:hypothetical protein